MRAERQYAESLRDKNEQLSRAVEQADRANAAKTSFLSHMTHDIRTPLNGIIGLLEIDAAHPEDTALVNANRKKAHVAADHLPALINDILQVSKPESGEVTLVHEVVLMDMMMPVMDGLTATHAIRALPRGDLASIPIIAMTANAFAEDAQRCLDAGMNAHLAKPLELDKVIREIARCCRGKP